MATKKAKSRGPAKRRAGETDITDIYLLPKPAEMEIRPLRWTPKQQIVIDTALDKKTKVILIRACAGVGKSAMAIFCGLTLLKEKRVDGITYVRVPLESSSNKLGFLPAGVEDKMAPYSIIAENLMREMISERDVQSLKESGAFEAIPNGFLKGRTFSRKVLIGDELEDYSRSEISMLMSRVGHGSTLILIGDSNQCNIKHSGFDEVFDLFDGEQSRAHGIHCFEFTKEDCMRSGIAKYILGKFEELRDGR